MLNSIVYIISKDINTPSTNRINCQLVMIKIYEVYAPNKLCNGVVLKLRFVSSDSNIFNYNQSIIRFSILIFAVAKLKILHRLT